MNRDRLMARTIATALQWKTSHGRVGPGSSQCVLVMCSHLVQRMCWQASGGVAAAGASSGTPLLLHRRQQARPSSMLKTSRKVHPLGFASCASQLLSVVLAGLQDGLHIDGMYEAAD